MLENTQAVTAVRWLSRFLSLGTFLFIGTFFTGEITVGDGSRPHTADWLGLLFFPVGLLIGLAVAWMKERLGGVMAILSVAAFYVWNYARSGTWPAGPWFFLLASPGIGFIIVSLMSPSNGAEEPSSHQRSQGLSA